MRISPVSMAPQAVRFSSGEENVSDAQRRVIDSTLDKMQQAQPIGFGERPTERIYMGHQRQAKCYPVLLDGKKYWFTWIEGERQFALQSDEGETKKVKTGTRGFWKPVDVYVDQFTPDVSIGVREDMSERFHMAFYYVNRKQPELSFRTPTFYYEGPLIRKIGAAINNLGSRCKQYTPANAKLPRNGDVPL